ncbi:reverse transcriptase domain-containing protein [Tanacetum coccineum]
MTSRIFSRELHQIDTFYNVLTQSDQDSLNVAAGGNLLNRTPRDALTIIENKSKVYTLRNKLVVSKVSATTSSTPAYLPKITALTDAVKPILLQNKTPSPASVKAMEDTCVTCGGPHPYYECLAADGNTFNAFAATRTYNQGGSEYRPQGETSYFASNQIRPPGFPQPNVQNNQNRYNQNQVYNQNRGNNFNQGNQNYQALLNQTQVGPSNDFSNYMRTNDVNMRGMQNQISNMKTELKNEIQSTMMNQNNELKNMMSSFIQIHNPSGSGSLPSNTIANPRGDLKVITTRSGVSYDGLTIPPTSSPLPKEVKRELEATKDKVQTTSTAHVQPLVVQVPIPEPDFLQIFQSLHFDISFADALLHMPKFASTFKSLLRNKEKLFEFANTLLNENCSAVLFKKLPKNLGDPDKFLIPCDFSKLDECLALSDLGASINLMPLSVWKKLSLPKLTPTRMNLELINRSVAYPVGVAEDVFMKVGKFHFPADFDIVDYDVDPRVPLILGRPFLRTARSLIDVHGEELTLRVNDEDITFNVGHTSRYSYRYDDESILSLLPLPPLSLLLRGGDFVLEENEACLTSDSIPPGIDDADFDPKELKIIKSSIDDPSS